MMALAMWEIRRKKKISQLTKYMVTNIFKVFESEMCLTGLAGNALHGSNMFL